MLLGALVDAGVPLDVLQGAIDTLGLGIGLRAEPVMRQGLGATKVHVDVPVEKTLRHLPQILDLLSSLPTHLSDQAGAVFTRLAEAEAAVHRVPIDAVHFHEVGALDAIADVVGVVAGMGHLRLDRLVCSTMGLGSGSAHTEHGRIPVPVPAVVELVTGAPCTAGPAPFEAMTPTGAALLVSLADEWGPMPEMKLERSGSGAGTKDGDDFANVVRVLAGERVGASEGALVQLEANVDDLDPRLWPAALEAILAAGAVDAWLTPITMKKGRPAYTLSALFEHAVGHRVRAEIFAQTSTIGVRQHSVTREVLERNFEVVHVEGHPVTVKLAWRDGRVVNRSCEWSDVDAAARALGRSPKEVLAAATKLAESLSPS